MNHLKQNRMSIVGVFRFQGLFVCTSDLQNFKFYEEEGKENQKKNSDLVRVLAGTIGKKRKNKKKQRISPSSFSFFLFFPSRC